GKVPVPISTTRLPGVRSAVTAPLPRLAGPIRQPLACPGRLGHRKRQSSLPLSSLSFVDRSDPVRPDLPSADPLTPCPATCGEPERRQGDDAALRICCIKVLCPSI